MNLKEYIKSLTREILDENEGGVIGNTTAAVPGYSSKNFLKKKVQEYGNYDQGAKYQKSQSTNNMYGGPSLATKGGGYYASAIKENSNKTFEYSNKIFKVGDKVKYNEVEWTIDDIIPTENMTFFMMSAPGMNNRKFDAVRVANNNVNESLINIVKEELLNEVTYHKFRNEVKFRTKNEILHKAIREVKRKLAEIDRIVEYTSRMKQELSEGEEGLQYWKKTESNIATISEMVNQLNNKIKNLNN
jgi:hypothetical protein